jgi:hypothetical protein
MRSFLGILAGIVVAIAVQSGVDLIASQFYPAAITDMWDRQQVAEALAARPTGALLFSVLGYFLGGFGGAYVAKIIARKGWAVWVPAGFLAAMALLIAFNFPLPAWTWFAMLAAPLIGGLIARHVGVDIDNEAEEQPEHEIATTETDA